MASRRQQQPSISNSRADRVGDVLRRSLQDWLASGESPGDVVDRIPEEVLDAYDTAAEYRAMHGYPLRKVTVGLRQFVERGSQEVNVAQRLKRMDRIVDKLVRFPKMRLSQMEDIAGCRAVLADTDEVARVLRRVRRNRWDIVRLHDYARHPKSSGYRAIHVIVRRDGRLVEIQLRTLGQHAWAEAVEAWTLRSDYNVKDEDAPADLLEFFRLAARGISLQEAGQEVDEATERRFNELRERAKRYVPREND